MSSIYLVRHGQASFGSANYDELSDRGRRQSRILGEYLFNTSLTRLIYGEDQLTLASFNNAAHLELTGDASLITYR